MREIKFRCLAFASQIMFNPDSDDGFELTDGKLFALPNTILMQFTGLYDGTKWEDLTEPEREQWTRFGNLPSQWEGREIYEGDIVSIPDIWTEPILDNGQGPDEEYFYIGKVQFKDGSFGIKGGAGSRSMLFSGDFHPFDNGDYFSGYCEVVGNIYESPGLVNEEVPARGGDEGKN